MRFASLENVFPILRPTVLQEGTEFSANAFVNNGWWWLFSFIIAVFVVFWVVVLAFVVDTPALNGRA
jgi:hypothetical protein